MAHAHQGDEPSPARPREKRVSWGCAALIAAMMLVGGVTIAAWRWFVWFEAQPVEWDLYTTYVTGRPDLSDESDAEFAPTLDGILSPYLTENGLAVGEVRDLRVAWRFGWQNGSWAIRFTATPDQIGVLLKSKRRLGGEGEVRIGDDVIALSGPASYHTGAPFDHVGWYPPQAGPGSALEEYCGFAKWSARWPEFASWSTYYIVVDRRRGYVWLTGHI